MANEVHINGGPAHLGDVLPAKGARRRETASGFGPAPSLKLHGLSQVQLARESRTVRTGARTSGRLPQFGLGDCLRFTSDGRQFPASV